MKLSVAYFAFASMWHSVLGQEESTFLRGSGAEGTVAEEDKRASFGDFFNSHEQQPPSLFEDDMEGIITKIVGGVPMDPREYKARNYDSKAVTVNHLFILSTSFVTTCVTYGHFLISPCSSLPG